MNDATTFHDILIDSYSRFNQTIINLQHQETI